MKKWVLIGGFALLLILLGCWLMITYWAATPYGQLDARTAVIIKLANLNAKFGSAPTIAEARAGNEKICKLIGGKQTPVSRVTNKDIPGPAGSIPVRIYIPEGNGPFPVVLYFHGGGFVVGSLNTHDNICRKIARHGSLIVIAVNYRLAPEHSFPAAAQDCYAAAHWANRHAVDFGGDGARLGVAGDSAGGNLAAVVALMTRNHRGPKISAQVLVYPSTNMSSMDTKSHKNFATGYLLTKVIVESSRDVYTPNPDDRVKPEVSPLLSRDFSGLPSALIITAEFDPLRDEGESYADRLKAAGVKTTVKRYQGMIHGFVSAPLFLPQAKQAIVEIGEFLKQELKQP